MPCLWNTGLLIGLMVYINRAVTLDSFPFGLYKDLNFTLPLFILCSLALSAATGKHINGDVVLA